MDFPRLGAALGRLPPWIRAPAALALALVLGAVMVAGLTTADRSSTAEFSTVLALGHVSFGFAYSSWWALTGSIIWVPIGLVAFRESDVLGLAGACLLAVAVITALLGAGVGLRRLLRRSRRWQAYEDRRREPFGRLPFPMAVGFALLLAGLMWTADALSGSALIVYLVAMLTLWAAPLGETTTPAHQEQDAGEPSVSATGHVKGTLASVAFVCGAIVLSLLFSEVAAWIGLSQDNSEDGPVLDSASLWAVLLGFFVAAQGAARLTSQVRESA